MRQNTSLYKNTGGEAFQDLNLQIGLARPTRMLSGWGIRFLDYDNDGWLDLIQVNSHPDDLVDLRTAELPIASHWCCCTTSAASSWKT